jgi:hypothetical protein
LAPSAAGDDVLKEVLSPTSNPVIQVSKLYRVTTVGAVDSTFNIAIPTSYNAKLEVNVIARQTAGSAGAVGDGAAYQRTIMAQNLASVVTMFKNQDDYTYEAQKELNFVLSASGANIVGTATGHTNRTISWGIHASLLMITT